jgi:hypothetical protein
VLPLLGIIAVVILTVVAAGHKNGDAKELLATAVTAVTTLAAASGGHAAGRVTRPAMPLEESQGAVAAMPLEQPAVGMPRE